jgi:hypothetical protein
MDPHVTSTSTVQYGVQSANGNTVLMVTEDLAEAERTLDIIGGGRVLQRIVSQTSWILLSVDATGAPTEPGDEDFVGLTDVERSIPFGHGFGG